MGTHTAALMGGPEIVEIMDVNINARVTVEVWLSDGSLEPVSFAVRLPPQPWNRRHLQHRLRAATDKALKALGGEIV